MVNRRNLLQTTGYAALGGAMLAAATPRASAQEREFDINQAFADFMRDIGGSADDAGGTVTFTGSDPILRSHFRIGASMALPAMAAGVGAAAMWRDWAEQDLKVDLRESIFNVNPVIRLVQLLDQAAGRLKAKFTVLAHKSRCLRHQGAGAIHWSTSGAPANLHGRARWSRFCLKPGCQSPSRRLGQTKLLLTIYRILNGKQQIRGVRHVS